MEETFDILDGGRHCDEYIRDPTVPFPLRWFLFVNRLPATDAALMRTAGVADPVLFATHESRKVRVVMASRLGDVGITWDLHKSVGYKARVKVEDLSDFTDQKPW